ncbi:hypothetical protein LDENG_00251000, partial [Lucifuga dentata]
MAKQALSAATAQAAAQAASSMRDFAQKSFRLSMDIKLKAPLIVVPQSSVSHNAVVVDLGLITVGNSFSLMAAEGFSLPAVVEKMDVQLTQLKLSRTSLKRESLQQDIEILQPINLELLVKRNLAASWFSSIPSLHVQGVLKSLNMSLGEEDFGVLMKILMENISEGSKEHRLDVRSHVAQEKAELAEQQVDVASSPAPSGDQSAMTNGGPSENTINVLVNFEIKEVALTLKKPRDQQEAPFLLFHVAQLGIDIKLRKYDMCATTYIRKISMQCLEFTDGSGEPLSLIGSSMESGTDLLKVKYFKADRAGPNFTTTHKNTKQMINVTFTSLDFMLHTEALLSTINFLVPSPERESRPKTEESKTVSAKSTALASPSDSDVIDLKVMMTLGAFNVLVCDQKCNMADIKIQGVNGLLVMQGSQTHLSARLRDFTVINVDPRSIHKKAVSIVGDEVFSFTLSLTPNATEGAGYADTSKTDGKVKLNVGCIQVLYLHKFVMSLLNFTNNFQMAKQALSAATAQAAAQAASSVRDFAQKSFQLSMDIRLKAPLIIVPQSSVSHNALEVDLGLITVGNSFSSLHVTGCPLPAIIDNMDVTLTQLKLSRICTDQASNQPRTELLEPVNFLLSIKRNLASSWYKKMAAVEIDGDLKPMKVALSQDDLKVLLRILTENLGEAGGLERAVPRQDAVLQQRASGSAATEGAETLSESGSQDEDEPLETMKFILNIESLGLVLYGNDPKQPSDLQQHQENLRLGEFVLHLMKASGRILTSGSMDVSTILTSCTLDDLRAGMDRVTSRMIGKRDEDSADAMIDVTYRQSGSEQEVVAVLQQLYVCASVEFLMAVADFFLQALPQSSAPPTTSAPTDRLQLKQPSEPRGGKTASAVRSKLRAVVVDPEVVFVASLMKADAPALVASFQCDFILQTEDDGTRNMMSNLRELKVLACPFIRSKMDTAVTTVLRPCSVVLKTKTQPNQPLSGSVTVEEVIVKISPFILNTVMNITAAMTAKKADEQQDSAPDVRDLWSIMNVYECNYWFLGVDQATEVTESFREQDGANKGENFTAEVKVVQVTLESGLGHRTVPLLLAESSFSGAARNWSSLLHLNANMTLEVNYFNECHAVWEPLIERVDGGTRRWNLELQMKNNPVQDKSPVHGDDFVILPEARTAVSICSKDTMNVTVSPSSLNVFSKLAT